jgi:hypothetical protein
MTMRLPGTEGDCRQATGRRAETAEEDPAQHTGTARAPVTVTWAGAWLGRQIQQAGAAPVRPPSCPHADARA